MKKLWTDGSASPNPGPGGFAVICDGKPVRLGREDNSTNIRMEGAAMRAGLLFLNGEEGEIHSDSEFWIILMIFVIFRYKNPSILPVHWTKIKIEG